MRAECGDVLMLAADFLLPLISSLLLVTAAAPNLNLQSSAQIPGNRLSYKMYSYLQDKKTCGYWQGDQTSPEVRPRSVSGGGVEECGSMEEGCSR